MHTFHIPIAPFTAFVLSLVVASYIISPVRTYNNTTCCKLYEKGLTQGDEFSTQSTFETIANVTAFSKETQLCNETRTEKFLNCISKICLEPDEFVMDEGIAYVAVYNKYYSSNSYELQEDGCLLICVPVFETPSPGNATVTKVDPNSLAQAYITLIGLCISILCLSAHLIAFAMISELRNTPGYCMACFCATLLSGYVSMLAGADENVMISTDACSAAACCTHFFLLSAFLWMNVMAFDVFKALLNATGKLRVASENFQLKRFCLYCAYSWGVAFVFTLTALISDKVKYFPEEYKPHFGKKRCWFNKEKSLLVFFNAPMIAVICTNVYFYGRSAYLIISSGMKNNRKHGTLKRNLVLYVRLAVIMGLTWVTGLLAALIDEVALWYIFILLNSFQGLFVFLGFTCTSKVKDHLCRRFGFALRKRSMQTSVQTSK